MRNSRGNGVWDRRGHRTPRGFDGALEVQGLNANEGKRAAQIQEPQRSGAVRPGEMRLEQVAQAALFFVFEFVGLDEFEIEDVVRFAAQDVAEASGHAGTEIQAHRAENRREAAGHVLATVLTHSFNHGHRTAIANRESFTRLTGDEQLAGGGSIEDGVAGKHIAALRGILAGVNDNGAAGKPFADVIVSFAEQFQGEAVGQERAETLARMASEFACGGRRLLLLNAEAHALAADVRANTAIVIVDHRGTATGWRNTVQKHLRFRDTRVENRGLLR